jgi:anti-sigma28 factor (negative regulator of flagellin synthesis)
MRIHDKQAAGIDLAKVVRNPAEQAGGPGQDPKIGRQRGGADEVRLSTLAEQIQSLDPASREMEARLDRLGHLVAAGRYQPDPEALADSLIEDALAGGGV